MNIITRVKSEKQIPSILFAELLDGKDSQTQLCISDILGNNLPRHLLTHEKIQESPSSNFSTLITTPDTIKSPSNRLTNRGHYINNENIEKPIFNEMDESDGDVNTQASLHVGKKVRFGKQESLMDVTSDEESLYVENEEVFDKNDFMKAVHLLQYEEYQQEQHYLFDTIQLNKGILVPPPTPGGRWYVLYFCSDMGKYMKIPFKIPKPKVGSYIGELVEPENPYELYRIQKSTDDNDIVINVLFPLLSDKKFTSNNLLATTFTDVEDNQSEEKKDEENQRESGKKEEEHEQMENQEQDDNQKEDNQSEKKKDEANQSESGNKDKEDEQTEKRGG